MNILLIGMNFYNYELEIKNELINLGNNVILENDVPDNFTFLHRCLPWDLVNKINARHQKRILKQNINQKFEIVLVIVGRYLHPFFLESIKKRTKRLVLYLWDDVARVENFEQVKHYYDEIYSFDPVDCYKLGFKFLPLFYTKEFFKIPPDTKKEIDIYTAVSNHSDRKKIIQWFIDNKKTNTKLLFYLNLGKFGYFKYLFSKRQKNEIINIPVPISKNKNIDFIRKSKTLLDIQFSSQIGLTIRTIESLGMGVKLITTNKSIKYYDFYNPNNIYILDRNKIDFDWNFLTIPYEPIPEELYKKYSLCNWCESIIQKKIDYYADIKAVNNI